MPSPIAAAFGLAPARVGSHSLTDGVASDSFGVNADADDVLLVGLAVSALRSLPVLQSLTCPGLSFARLAAPAQATNMPYPGGAGDGSEAGTTGVASLELWWARVPTAMTGAAVTYSLDAAFSSDPFNPNSQNAMLVWGCVSGCQAGDPWDVDPALPVTIASQVAAPGTAATVSFATAAPDTLLLLLACPSGPGTLPAGWTSVVGGAMAGAAPQVTPSLYALAAAGLVAGLTASDGYVGAGLYIGAALVGTPDGGSDDEGGGGSGPSQSTATLQPDLVWLEWSDDRGHTWSNPVSISLGGVGGYITSLQWRRLGYARDRVFRLTWSAALPTALQGAWIDVKPGSS